VQVIGRSLVSAARRLGTSLRGDRRGLALTEFALAAPLVITIGGYGIELSNYAVVQLRISQVASNLADNASRVGLTSTLTTTQLRETDINDVLIAARIEGDPINLTTYGRITLSSLENVQQSWDSAAVQRIHWQRCLGLKSGTGYDSTYGTTSTSAGTDTGSSYAGTAATTGMGATDSKVLAPDGSGVMFVEINYAYQPLFGSLFIPTRTIGYVASFVVRDKRDYAKVYNPSPEATRSTCNLYTA
jgi:Flp pilus assembly protein TadG